MHKLSLILIFSLFMSVLVSGRACDPTDPLIKFMRELKGARQECASYLRDHTTRTVTTTTSVDSPPTTLSTEIDRETTIGSVDVARITNTVKHTDTETVTSAIYDVTSYSTVVVTMTSVPSPQARTSTAFQTITTGGTTAYYTITITSFRVTTTAATLASATTTGVLITTYFASTTTTSGKPPLVTSARTSLITTLPDYSTETITATSLLLSTPLTSVKSTKTGSNNITTGSDYLTETITASSLLSYNSPGSPISILPTSIRNGSTPAFSATITPSSLLSSAPLKTTKPIITPSNRRNFTSTPVVNNATGTGRASSLLPSPLPATTGSTKANSTTYASASPGLESYATETRTAPFLLPSSPSVSTSISSYFSTPLPPLSPTTVTAGTSKGPSVPLAPVCTEYTITITVSDIFPRPSTATSTFITLGSIYNTSISTNTTRFSTPLTPSPSPPLSPSAGPGPVMNRWRRFNVPQSSSTTPSNSWYNATMTAAPIIPENGLGTYRLYDRHPGDTSSACSCIMPYLLSQPKVTVVFTKTIPPRMIWVTKTKVFTKVHIDGTTTSTTSIVRHTTKHVTIFHTKTKEAVTTKFVPAPGIAESAPVVTVTSTTTVQTPVTSTVTQYTTIYG